MLTRIEDVDPRELARKALEIAQASPDFTYHRTDPFGPACVYVDPFTNEGSCLLGRALLALGVSVDDLFDQNMTGIEDLLGIDAPLLGNAQGAQDAGFPWGSSDVIGNLVDFLGEDQ